MVEDGGDDGHGGQEVLMPGFRFHPTEEELVEFYLRRKVEGKRFPVELITLLDLYRHDPWELPALAAVGDKEWFFYVPRDRKYRNGDRPNRVTRSGYWKATGADRLVRTESSRSVGGLKKTLVFYHGKAPRGARTAWIMNEYRLSDDGEEDRRGPTAEISLCRVYKRAGADDHHRLLASSTRSSSFSTTAGHGKTVNDPSRCPTHVGNLHLALAGDSMTAEQEGYYCTHEARGGFPHSGDSLPLPDPRRRHPAPDATTSPLLPLSSTTEEEDTAALHGKDVVFLLPTCTLLGSSSPRVPAAAAAVPAVAAAVVDELNNTVGYDQSKRPAPANQLFGLSSQPHAHLTLSSLAASLAAFTGRRWY